MRVTKDPEVKTSGKGQPFFKANAVVDREDGPVWVTLLGFGPLVKGLEANVVKGTLLKASGKLTTKEYTSQKTGEMGLDNTLFVSTAKISTKNGVVEVDEFYEAPSEETKATTDAPF